MVHILAGCKTALSQGRYRWCRDKVTEKASDQYETNTIHTVHQGRGESTRPQEDQKEPPPSSSILGDEGGSGKETTLPPGCANIAEAGRGRMV